jgi:hypothetical protein
MEAVKEEMRSERMMFAEMMKPMMDSVTECNKALTEQMATLNETLLEEKRGAGRVRKGAGGRGRSRSRGAPETARKPMKKREGGQGLGRKRQLSESEGSEGSDEEMGMVQADAMELVSKMMERQQGYDIVKNMMGVEYAQRMRQHMDEVKADPGWE